MSSLSPQAMESAGIRPVTADNEADAVTAPSSLYDPTTTFVNGEDDAGGRSRGRCRRRLVDVAFAFTFVRDDHVVDAVFALDGRGEDHSLFHRCFVGVWLLGAMKIKYYVAMLFVLLFGSGFGLKIEVW